MYSVQDFVYSTKTPVYSPKASNISQKGFPVSILLGRTRGRKQTKIVPILGTKNRCRGQNDTMLEVTFLLRSLLGLAVIHECQGEEAIFVNEVPQLERLHWQFDIDKHQ